MKNFQASVRDRSVSTGQDFSEIIETPASYGKILPGFMILFGSNKVLIAVISVFPFYLRRYHVRPKMNHRDHLAYAVAFSTQPVIAFYRRARRWVDGLLSVFFTFAAFQLATFRN